METNRNIEGNVIYRFLERPTIPISPDRFDDLSKHELQPGSCETDVSQLLLLGPIGHLDYNVNVIRGMDCIG